MKTFTLKNRTQIVCIFLICIIGLSACKKDKTTVTEPDLKPSTDGSRRDLTLDSIYLYAKQVYYWNDVLPDYARFNPRSYNRKSADLDNYDDILYAITQLKKDPTTGIPYEYYGDGFPKFSYIQDKTTANPNVISFATKRADVNTDGNGLDIGIRPVYYITDNPAAGAYFLFVTAVYPGSPAAAAGVQRGWLINKVNGISVGTNYNAERARVNSALDANSVKIEGYNFMDNVPFSLTLNRASYKSSPVYAAKVINRGGKKIGYLSFARFSSLTDVNGNSDANLDPVFNDFNTQGVTDLVIDLRYNGGGYIETAQYLANLIAPASLSGKKMYVETYNATMQAKAENTILKNQPLLNAAGKVQYRQNGTMITYDDVDYSIAGNTVNFEKKGSLNTVTSVVFIVTNYTASASELLINSLKPYLNVKLVGDTTYGKPVGFFPITIENRYEVYMSQFETLNANNEGGYYRGMVPNKVNLFDDPRYPFGNENEGYLADALQLIVPMTVLANQSATMTAGQRSLRIATFGSTQLKPAKPNSEFVGMIETRHKLKK